MYKIFLMLICLFLVKSTQGQDLKNTPQDDALTANSIINGLAINLPKNADEYFTAADRNEKNFNFNEALALFNRSAIAYQNNKEINKYALTLLRISNVQLILTQYTEAEQTILNKALRAYSKAGNSFGQMTAYNQLARVYLINNKLTQALWFYTQQGILAQLLNNKTALIESILGVAAVKIKKNEYAMAYNHINTAETLAKNANTNQFDITIKAYKAIILEQQLATNKPL